MRFSKTKFCKNKYKNYIQGGIYQMTNEDLVKLVQSSENVTVNMKLLFKQNKRLIYKFVHDRVDNINDLDDLMQQAYIGLYNAALAYDQDKMKCLFATMMKFHMLNSIRDNNELPEHIKLLINRYRKFKAQYYFDFGIPLSDYEICERLKIDEKKLDIIKMCSKPISSLDSPTNDEGYILLINSIADESIENFDTALENEHLKQILDQALSKLPEREEHTIKELYYKNRTLESVGNDIGTGWERARQIKEKGLRKLRQDWKLRKDVKDYLSDVPIRHVGLSEFKHTGTSSVEWSILHMENEEEYYRNRLLNLLA